MKPETTYVFENIEVRLTGRTSSRVLPSGRVDILHEVTPVDSMVGSWKKWVKLQAMHEVQG